MKGLNSLSSNISLKMNKIIAAALTYFAMANNVSKIDRDLGWVQGQGRTGIFVEIFLDLISPES